MLSVAFNRDGTLLMSGSKDKTVQFWDPRSAASATRSITLQGHDNSVIRCAPSTDSPVLLLPTLPKKHIPVSRA